MDATLKPFSESYNQENAVWEKPAFEDVTKIVLVAFKETIPETALKNLLTKITLTEIVNLLKQNL